MDAQRAGREEDIPTPAASTSRITPSDEADEEGTLFILPFSMIGQVVVMLSDDRSLLGGLEGQDQLTINSRTD